jgi:polyferredoxin
VAVCPDGIDSRDGLQLECIGCALWSDACDEIMGKIESPQGLIAYDTEANVVARMAGEKPRFRLIRARTMIYAVVFAAVGGIMLYSLLGRSTLDLNVVRDRQPNFVRLSNGSIQNGYTIKVLNKATETRTLTLSVDGLPSPTLKVAGQTGLNLIVPADDIVDFRVLILEDDLVDIGVRGDVVFKLVDPVTNVTAIQSAVFVTGS